MWDPPAVVTGKSATAETHDNENPDEHSWHRLRNDEAAISALPAETLLAKSEKKTTDCSKA